MKNHTHIIIFCKGDVMGKLFSTELIDDLIQKVKFEEVLNHYNYPVRGSGKNRGSICPKCNKDHDHFKINTLKNLANCFVCSWGGNPIQFIQELEQCNFVKAVKIYAQIGNYKLTEQEEMKKELSLKDRILNSTIEFYSKFESEYLINRGISKEVIKNEKIGYAPGGRKLKDHLNSLSFSDEDLLSVGVLKVRNNRKMDYFYQCVIIPIYLNGQIVDIYGRYTSNKASVKHLYLYGEFSPFNIDKVSSEYPVIIVESPINVLTLLSYDITNTFSTGGAKRFSQRHLKLLKSKNISKAYIAYDTGDLSNAGQSGSITTGKLLYEYSISSNIIQMPLSVDINELFLTIENPVIKLKELITSSEPFHLFEGKYILDQLPSEWILNYVKKRGLL